MVYGMGGSDPQMETTIAGLPAPVTQVIPVLRIQYPRPVAAA